MMKIGDAVRLRPGSLLRARLAPFGDAVGCVIDTFQYDDDDGLRIGVSFPDQIYGFLTPLSAEEFVVDLSRPDDPF